MSFTNIQSMLFLAQMQQAVSYGAGLIYLILWIVGLAGFGWGAGEVVFHKNMSGAAVAIVGVILIAMSPNIVNTLFGGMGNGNVHITPANVN